MSLGTKGAIAGALYVRAKEESASHDHTLTELQMQSFKATKRLIYSSAAKEALGKLMREIFLERAANKPARMSDPKNRELRNDRYVELFAEIVASSASGRRVPRGMTLFVSDEVKREYKALRTIK